MKMPGNMQSMMKQAQQMQQRLQEEIAAIRVEASAGGGMVSVKMDGQKRMLNSRTLAVWGRENGNWVLLAFQPTKYPG